MKDVVVRQFMRPNGLLPQMREPELVIDGRVIRLPNVTRTTVSTSVDGVTEVTITLLARYEHRTGDDAS